MKINEPKNGASAGIYPLIEESPKTEAMGLDTVMNRLADKTIAIPEYQRDSDQWDKTTKSLLIESVINNLSIPAFFFETVTGEDRIRRSEVVDGQQRLTTLYDFFHNSFTLVASDEASYISPNSVHYADSGYYLMVPC